MNLYDGVTIPPEGHLPALNGVIVYKDGDTIGIRLTGDSEGMGDHSGNVDGIDYFECPVNSGILTTSDKVSKRPRLTIAEEAMIRAMLQPSISIPPPSSNSSMPISGLSPSALARMAQLNQRMQASSNPPPPPPPPTAPPLATRNPLPPTMTTTAAATAPNKVSDEEPSVPTSANESTVGQAEKEQEPPAPAQQLSRLEILRQKKEALRLRKLALQGKVQDKKDTIQQQKQDEDGQDDDEEEPKVEPMEVQTEEEPTASAVEMPKVPLPTRTEPAKGDDDDDDDEEEIARPKAERRESRDSLEKLWISELRQESPPAAERYGMDEDDDDDDENAPLQPSLEPNNNNDDDDDIMEEDDKMVSPTESAAGGEESGSKRKTTTTLSRLQQLRQKKRLLEALPASINTSAPNMDAEVRLDADGRASSPPSLFATPSTAAVAPASSSHNNNNNETTDDIDQDEEDNVSRTSTISTQVTDLMELEEDHGATMPAAATTTTSSGGDGTMNEEEEEDTVPAAFQESVTITTSATAATTEESSSEPEPQQQQQQHSSQKRRRMLGLGFLPGNRRMQKRQKGQHQ